MCVEAGHSVATLCHLGNIARRLGRRLKWDPEKEIFPGDDEANQYVDCPNGRGMNCRNRCKSRLQPPQPILVGSPTFRLLDAGLLTEEYKELVQRKKRKGNALHCSR